MMRLYFLATVGSACVTEIFASTGYILQDAPEEELLQSVDKYNALYGSPDFSHPSSPTKNMFVDRLENRTDLPTPDATNPPPPVVIMHGLLDAGLFEIGFCIQIALKYHAHVKCLDVDDLLASAYVKAEDQLRHLTHALQSDRKLVQQAGANNNQGFYLVGISQGGILCRSFIERINSPRVSRFVSWTGVQNGIATCPASTSPALCARFKNGLLGGPYNSPLFFSDYWRDPTDKNMYLRKSRFLADLNNERREGCYQANQSQSCDAWQGKRIINETYQENMKGLEWYVQIEATADSMIYPHASESHGEYSWNRTGNLQDNLQVVQMAQTDEYRDDVIGLKTLNEQKLTTATEGKVRHWMYVGQHVQIPYPMWEQWLKPVLGGAQPHASAMWGTAGEKEARREQIMI